MTPGLIRQALIAVSMLAFAGCSRSTTQTGYPEPAGPNDVVVMSYNLTAFGLADRDNDGQKDDFKPEEEVNAAVGIIMSVRPHILALQEVGDEKAIEDLRQRLSARGLEFNHSDLLIGPHRELNLAILSQNPIDRSLHVTNLTFSIRDHVLPVQRGFQQVDILVGATQKMRIVNVHLKSKRFHVAGHTEMRRNEARLLATHLRRSARETDAPPLVVCGDFSDSLSSAAMREIINDESRLTALSIRDGHGDDWTYHSPEDQTYTRTGYFLADSFWSTRWQVEKSGIIRGRDAAVASAHRPLVAAFSIKD
jgi:endonuclease/exonuclease/phosphatase family metal-dependent hydrolase